MNGAPVAAPIGAPLLARVLAPVLAWVLALGLGAATAAETGPENPAKAAVIETVETFLDLSNRGFTQGHPEAIDGVVGDQGVILDDGAPFVWAGPGAFQTWAKAVVAGLPRDKPVSLEMRMRKPSVVTITDERAYVTVEGRMTLIIAGETSKQRGLLTFVLASHTKPEDPAWKIIGLSFGRTSP